MSDYIERKSIRNLYSYLDPEGKVRVAQVLIDIDAIPPAEVIPKGSDEASLAYAEGWKNGEKAERSRHKMNATGDLIERSEVLKQLWLNHKDVVYIDKKECARRIEAIPSARPKEGKWIEVEWYPIAVPSKWCENDEKPIYASKLQCSKCGFTRNFLDGHTAQYNFCPQCGSDNREREGE